MIFPVVAPRVALRSSPAGIQKIRLITLDAVIEIGCPAPTDAVIVSDYIHEDKSTQKKSFETSESPRSFVPNAIFDRTFRPFLDDFTSADVDDRGYGLDRRQSAL